VGVFDHLVSGAAEQQLGAAPMPRRPITIVPASVSAATRSRTSTGDPSISRCSKSGCRLADGVAPAVEMGGDLVAATERRDVLAVDLLGQPDGVDDDQMGPDVLWRTPARTRAWRELGEPSTPTTTGPFERASTSTSVSSRPRRCG
jgi:hypothetical protein